jgi:hypothetical protein
MLETVDSFIRRGMAGSDDLRIGNRMQEHVLNVAAIIFKVSKGSIFVEGNDGSR